MILETGRSAKKGSKILVLMLVDFENLLICARDNIEPTRFSIESGFKRIIKNIADETGEIVGIFAFLPSDRAMVWGRELYEMGFNIINCPRIKTKKGQDEDTTDSRLMELGEWLINNIKSLTHICVATGDSDFSPLLEKAALKGLKTMVVAANVRSLSPELIRLTDINPLTKRKMIYLFSPIKE